MKYLPAPLVLLGLSLCISSASASAEVIRLSEPTATDAHSETFGALWDPQAEIVPLRTALEKIDLYVDRPLVIRASIGQVCQKKGCFFIAQDGPHAIRVSFRDYGFFIPTDTSGKTVVLAGELARQQVAASEAQHYAEDLGAADVQVPQGEVIELVADGIRIPL